MTNPDQLPERLIAFRPKRSPTSLAGGPAFAAEEQRPGDRPTCAEEQVYVREDVAEQRVGMAKREAEIAVMERNAVDYERDDERKRARKAEVEAAALRAEVEALRSLAKRAADLLRPSFRLTVDGRDTPPNALVADIDAALAKGVG